ncbi:MAG: heme-binding protein [Gemmatimonadota bacterium]
MSEQIRPTFKDILSSIPGVFGIRLEEEPAFDVVDTLDDVEVRRYQPALLARVTVPGDHEAALDEAFTRLAGYIYGKNSGEEKLGMTSPVFQEEGSPYGARQSMTTPVLQSESGTGWTIAFFLSNDMRKEDAPVPNDPSIELVEQPAQFRATLRYSGNNNDERRADAKQRLLEALRSTPRWRVLDDVSWAQYDQPFAIPFLKRNEAQVAVEEAQGG